MKKRIFLIVGMLLIVSSLSAETVGIIKLYKGKAYVKRTSKSRWTRVKMNMKLSDKAILKTGRNGMIQLKLKGGAIYKLQKSTKKSMKSILAGLTKKNNSSALAKLRQLRNKLGKGTSKGNSGVTAVAGVRGADMSKHSSSPVKSSELIWEE